MRARNKGEIATADPASICIGRHPRAILVYTIKISSEVVKTSFYITARREPV